jgi:hypothetical protein
METALVLPKTCVISLPEWVKALYAKLKAFIQRNKEAIGAATITALALDVITGIIFGFGGAALFAAL